MDCDVAELISDSDGFEIEGVLPRAIDPHLAERLWKLSEKMTGVTFSDLSSRKRGTTGR